MAKATRVGIVGYRGYSGAELIHILDRHPSVQPVLLEHRHDVEHRAQPINRVHHEQLPSTPEAVAEGDLAAVFLATPPEVSMELAPAMLWAGTRVVDLSGAFRFRDAATYKRWYKEEHTAPDLLKEAVYGLPEFCRGRIAGARFVSNPGCYPTAANLAIKPLMEAGVVDPASGINNATIRLDAHPEKVPPGIYQATLTVDAGPLAGSKTFPVTFTVSGPGPGGPLITNVFNAASLSPGPLVAGSLAAIFGSGFAGEQVSVTFDGAPASFLYKSATQINLQVPVSVAGEVSSQMVVMVDGHSSAPQAVPMAAAAPGIFHPGILNQNNTLNTAANPAARGSTIEILCTGLISPDSGAISAVIAGQTITKLVSAGPLAGVPGVQQVTVAIPKGIPAGATQVEVCAVATTGNPPVCSMPASVMVK